MFAKLHVSVASCGDVEVSLHLVALDRAPHPTRVGFAAEAWRLWELALLLRGANVVMHILSFALSKVLLASLRILLAAGILASQPLAPSRRILFQKLSGEHAIAGGVLDVDVHIVAFHRDHDVQVQLEIVRDALFDGERMCRRSGEPTARFRKDQRHGRHEK